MSETGSALAINEKKTQITGGCVGIFFQLFHWNSGFAKKKLIPNKLLCLGWSALFSFFHPPYNM